MTHEKNKGMDCTDRGEKKETDGRLDGQREGQQPPSVDLLLMPLISRPRGQTGEVDRQVTGSVAHCHAALHEIPWLSLNRENRARQFRTAENSRRLSAHLLKATLVDGSCDSD